MSIVACVKVYDGIVLGAESMSQLMGQAAPGQVQFVKAYSNAKKLFQIGKSFGVLAYGVGNIGHRSVESLVSEFNDQLPAQADGLTGQELATRLLTFIRTPYNAAFGETPEKPIMGFYLAGYSQGEHVGTEWEFILPNHTEPIQPRSDDQFGASWRGVSIPFARLYFGIDQRLFDILQAQGLPPNVIDNVRAAATQLQSPIVFDGMPIQDAIGFCRFILDTTINETTYEIGVPSCGGPLHVGIITRKEGFSWVTAPKYSIERARDF